jgi:hypothetical protein
VWNLEEAVTMVAIFVEMKVVCQYCDLVWYIKGVMYWENVDFGKFVDSIDGK